MDEPDLDVEYVERDGRWWGASGSQLASSVAGGWPPQTGPRWVMLSGGPRGSSAAGQGDDAMVELLGRFLVRQWIYGLRQFLGACAVLCFFSTRRGTRILRSSLAALWCARLRVTLSEELRTVDTSVAFRGNWTLRSRAPCIWQFLFAVWVLSSCYASTRFLRPILVLPSWGLAVWRSAHSFCFGLLGLLATH